MKKDRKDQINRHARTHHGGQYDKLITENHKEHVEFLKDRTGISIPDDDSQKAHAGGDHPHFPPIDTLFKSDKDEKRIEEGLDRSFELAKENPGNDRSGMTRRNFLKIAGLATAGAGLAIASTSCLTYRPVIWPPNTYKQRNYDGPGPTETAKVAVVKGSANDSASIEARVRAAIAAAGGLGLIKQGEYVLIKPNTVWFSNDQLVPDPADPVAPVVTNPEVIRAVIRAVKERTSSSCIYVGDHSAIFQPTLFVMQQQGILDVCNQEGVNSLPMEYSWHVWFKSDKFQYLREPFHIPDPVLRVDHMINVPVLKNHEMPIVNDSAQYTCCLKAFVGIMSPDDRMLNDNWFHLYNLPEKVAELNLCRPWRMENGTSPGITMNVVDATDIMVAGGPSLFYMEMMAEHPNMILASTDRVACDTVAVALLRYYGQLRGLNKDYILRPVWEQRQIRHAALLGLGIADRNRTEIEFQGLDATEQSGILSLWNEGAI